MKIFSSLNYDKYAEWIYHYRIFILLFTSLLTIFAITYIPEITVKNDSDKFSLDENNPVIKSQKLFNSLFGSDEYIYLLIESDSTNNWNILKVVQSVTEQIKDLEGVKNVLSLIDAERIEWIPVFNTIVPTPAPIFGNKFEQIDIDTLKTILGNSSFYFGNLVSNDLSKFNVIINLESKDGVDYKNNLESLLENINKIMLSYSDKQISYYLAGAPLLDREMSSIVKEDLALFVPLSVITSVLILLFVARRLFPIIIVMLVSSISLIWSLGVISMTDTSMSVGLSVIVPLILVINIAYSLHYIYHYQSASSYQAGEVQILKKTFEKVLTPSLLAGTTTAVGFFSLLTSTFAGIQEIGTFIGLGVLFSMFNTNVVLPALLSFRKISSKERVNLFSLFLNKICEFTIARYKLIIFLFSIALVAAVYGIINIKTDTNILDYIDEDYQIRKSFNKIDNEFGGTLPLEIILISNYDSVDKDIDLIDSLSSKINKENLIGNTNSVVDILKFIDSSRPTEEDNIFIPFSFREKIFPSSIWKTISKSEIGKNFVSVKDSIIYFRINCRVKSVGSDELKSLLFRIESHYNNSLKDRILKAGIVPFFVESNSYLISSQINSFTIAFIFILFFFLLFTHSIKLGLIALIPNTFPIIFTIGLLGIFNIPLDLSNIMIASIAIGIIVDDTIHFLYNYLKDKTLKAVDNIRLVYKSISFPILSTSIIVSAGFFILGFSNFVPTKYFGILAGILVIIALISDLILFPALLKLFENTKMIKHEIH